MSLMAQASSARARGAANASAAQVDCRDRLIWRPTARSSSSCATAASADLYYRVNATSGCRRASVEVDIPVLAQRLVALARRSSHDSKSFSREAPTS
jgi:hypothetical protein